MTSEQIPVVRLGTEGPEVGAQGLGCMGISFAYGPTDGTEARAALERALELGVTHFDTADMYGSGDNERFLAAFVRAHREQIVLATKFGIAVDPHDPTRRTIHNDRAYIRRSIEASLKRLEADHVDLYYMHRRDLTVPIEETVGAMAELVVEGKVRHLGLSEVTGAELRAAHRVHPITAVQSEWSLFSRDVEKTVVPAARELGVAFVPYSPLSRSFLSGSFTNAHKDLTAGDLRGALPRFTGDNAAANAELLEPLRAVAAEHSATPAQIALAWVHQQARVHGLTVVPIPGTRKRTRVEENTRALRITLSEEALSLLDRIADQVAGVRYPDVRSISAGREEDYAATTPRRVAAAPITPPSAPSSPPPG
ncbi:aldo/keto reductase [Streptomyces sp. NPDC005408]|uniref:aldo/keto reductase n=1 Tax=Streptomyces sp. NPDC005408 TaxID=3155341 RepID=UPI0033BEEFCB